MGILNVTPDSFSNGGQFNEVKRAVARAKEMVEEGADIVDVGGESTRPGSEPVPVDEELKRVVPVVRELIKEVNVPISVDTRKAEVALECLRCGAHLINDVSGLKFDPRVARVVAEFGVPIVLMHMRGTPKDMQLHAKYGELISEIILQLRESIKLAHDEGVEQIIIDPGIGFGKKTIHNLEILCKLREFKSLGYPILVGTSRKSLIGDVLKLPIGERLEGTAATVAVSILNGANIIRVHDVREMVRVARMVDAIRDYHNFE
jgi:dihydropteroate synthase